MKKTNSFILRKHFEGKLSLFWECSRFIKILILDKNIDAQMTFPLCAFSWLRDVFCMFGGSDRKMPSLPSKALLKHPKICNMQ